MAGACIQKPAASVQVNPTNPTGTNSTSGVMMGLGAQATPVAFTPSGTGIVDVTITGVEVISAGAAGSTTVGGRYGTGTAPANGAADTGTHFGPASDMQFRMANVSATAGTPFTIKGRVALTAGTKYWFDLFVDQAVGTNTGGPVTIAVIIEELVS